jgi:hypothetical protein
MFGKKGIQLDPALMEKVRAPRRKRSTSPTSLVAHVLERELTRTEDAPRRRRGRRS